MPLVGSKGNTQSESDKPRRCERRVRLGVQGVAWLVKDFKQFASKDLQILKRANTFNILLIGVQPRHSGKLHNRCWQSNTLDSAAGSSSSTSTICSTKETFLSLFLPLLLYLSLSFSFASPCFALFWFLAALLNIFLFTLCMAQPLFIILSLLGLPCSMFLVPCSCNRTLLHLATPSPALAPTPPTLPPPPAAAAAVKLFTHACSRQAISRHGLSRAPNRFPLHYLTTTPPPHPAWPAP